MDLRGPAREFCAKMLITARSGSRIDPHRYAMPVTKASYDVTQRLNFSAGGF